LFDPFFASYAINGDLNAVQRLSLPCQCISTDKAVIKADGLQIIIKTVKPQTVPIKTRPASRFSYLIKKLFTFLSIA